MQRTLFTRGGTLVLGLFFVIFLVNQVRWCEFADNCQSWPSEEPGHPKTEPTQQTPDAVPSPQPVGDVAPQPGKDTASSDERTGNENPINVDGDYIKEDPTTREDPVDEEDLIHKSRPEGSTHEDPIDEEDQDRPDAVKDAIREDPGDEEDPIHEVRPGADEDGIREDPGDEENPIHEDRPGADDDIREDPDEENPIHEGRPDADDDIREDPGDGDGSVHEGRPDADKDDGRPDAEKDDGLANADEGNGPPDAEKDNGPANADEGNGPPDADEGDAPAGVNEDSTHADVETPEVDPYDFRALLPKNILSADDDVTPTEHTPKNPPFTIVTTASENHFCPLNAWIYNLNKVIERTAFAGDRPRIVVYDLGLLRFQRKILHSLKTMGYIDEARTFKFSLYPPHMNVHVKAGEYAWKPVMITEVARDYPGVILWMDSGSIPQVRGLLNAVNLVESNGGFAAARSSGTFLEWTHPGVFDFYGDDDPERFADVKNCNAAEMLWDSRKLPHILYEWLRCALHHDCIGPEGSSRSNHRQDQAVLTYILASNGLNCDLFDEDLGISHHHDGNCDEVILEWQRSHGPVFKPTAGDKAEIKAFKHKYRHGHWTDVWTPGN